jgi:hypothetical protein
MKRKKAELLPRLEAANLNSTPVVVAPSSTKEKSAKPTAQKKNGGAFAPPPLVKTRR